MAYVGSWSLINAPAGHTIQLEAQAAIAVGDPVKLDADGCDVAGDGDGVIGVAQTAAAIGENVTVLTEGIFAVVFGATIAMGNRVYAAAAGAVDAGSAANPAVGVVVKADATSGARGWVKLTSCLFTTFEHA